MTSTRPPGAPPTAAPEARRRIPAPGIFYPALAIIGAVVVSSIAFPDAVGDAIAVVQENVIGTLGWYYTLAVSGFVIFAVWMGVGRFGDITLGRDDDDPEFSLMAWFSMLFAAGMGIGLVFWGAAEPLTFFTDPKPGVTGSEADLANAAMAQVFLHWGFHAWAIYVVVGLAMAYAIHRKGRSVSLRWALEPLFGDRVKGRIGDAVDVVAIVGTIAGVATSLGLGVQQIAAGLVNLGVLEETNDTVQTLLIVGIMAIAIVSVVSGIGKGIKWLSNANLVLAGVFAMLVLALGSTLFLLRDFVQNIGGYLANIVPMSFNTSALAGDAGIEWQAAWTTFYWGWWISWAPFVGLFIARISRGRTIREFVAGVLLVPTLVTAVWFTILGGSAIMRQMTEGDLLDADGGVTSENVLFDLLQGLPAGSLLAGIAIIMITIFFITSADSGSLVIDMLASGGDPNPPVWSRVMWASLIGAVAIGLMLAGGLQALQTGAILTAVPFSAIMVAMAVATYMALKAEHREIVRLARRARLREWQTELAEQVTDDLVEHFDQHFAEPVDERISLAFDDRDVEDPPPVPR
ncbi:transporter, betaine/carnitine/choline family [Aeromicrobium marinum DSM 15272]|uniref:Transporter, betaine/carnitine/choline family n=1 Tax=Aeromicrobium marinum DSM 15272 TaxID=585531 RepID=E2SEV6_9ACTN|nr:BCCT family transporter [Aeromicrobium marinum]EFQ82403.1 transporter, betaine/carnitine/choline family [Aeromicrobium marinum DSM 15272]